MNVICFALPGNKICVYVPSGLRFPHYPEPDPGPWLHIDDVRPEVVRDMEALAQIQAISERLSGDLAAPVLEAVAAGAQKLQRDLPKGIEFSIETLSSG